MNLTWSQKRKIAYLSAVLVPVALLSAYLTYSFFDREPTCNDGIQNQNERGVDCGGVCERICQAQVPSPALMWARSFAVTEDIANSVAYYENPNSSLVARDVPFVFELRDSENLLIAQRQGTVDIPPRSTFAVFAGGIEIDGRNPVRTTFRLGDPYWQSADPSITRSLTSIEDTVLSPNLPQPRLEAEVANISVLNIGELELVSIIYDGAGNAVQASRTFINDIPAGSSKDVTFTWRQPFEPSNAQCASNVRFSIGVADVSVPEVTDAPSARMSLQEFVRTFPPPSTVGVVPVNATSSATNGSAATQLVSVLDSIEDTPVPVSNLLSELENLVRESREANASGQPVAVLVTGDTDPVNPEGTLQRLRSLQSSETTVYVVDTSQESEYEYLTQALGSQSAYFRAPSARALSQVMEVIRARLCDDSVYVSEIIPLNVELAN